MIGAGRVPTRQPFNDFVGAKRLVACEQCLEHLPGIGVSRCARAVHRASAWAIAALVQLP